MSQNNNRGRKRGARKQTNSRAVGRKPKLDPSRGLKRGKSKLTSDDRRAAARSVFAKTKSANGDVADESIDRGRRLQQVLAAAGYGSRRQCEELILDGRVDVDGKIVTELGVRVFPGEQKIRVDGEALPKAKPVYVALNKPKNTLCTNHDPSGRRRVVDFIPDRLGRLFPVGRLDQNSEGLILLTNDGALAERLTHPRYEAPKKYRVQVAGLVDYELADALKRGVHIAEGIVQADDVVIRSRHKLSSVLEITLTEGKNREIRRMLARVGHKVMQLQRVQVGSIKLGKLAPGEYRLLTSREVAELYRMADARPDARTLDVDKLPSSLRQRPLEISEIEEREAEKEAKREAAKERKQGGKTRKDDPNFHDEVKKQLKRRFEDDYSDRRRAPKDEFREEFRSKERSDERRRVRREYDDEERTIGPKVFDREESDSKRDRFNEDASARRKRRTQSVSRRAPEKPGKGGAKARKGSKSKKSGR
ncbi:MAG: rRNA pseudouridine synthase [Thermoguttaceae bacterium]|nr:rRNA pseudouridine synthase [Thermoguttaceae bacterium]